MSPIKDKSRYPKDWKEISLRIRERSGGRCECKGECGLHRSCSAQNPCAACASGVECCRPKRVNSRCAEMNGTKARFAKGKVVLTVAHLNHEPMDCRPENPCAVCASGVECCRPKRINSRCAEMNGTKARFAKGKVVLTVAHLNHEPSDCREVNLRAYCQRCHLRYDNEHHIKNARATRRAKLNNQEFPL